MALLLSGWCMLAGTAPAAGADRADSGTEYTEIYVNPLYEELTPGNLTFEEENEGFQLLAAESETVFYDTVDEAAEVLLEGMKKREATIRVGVTERLYNELAGISSAHKEIFYRAYAHDPADPTGGDYIRFTFGGWKAAYKTAAQGRTLIYYFQYYSTAEEEAAVDARVAELTAAWKAMNMTEYQTIRTIYEYITTHVTYDNAGLDAYRNAAASDTLTMNHCKIFTAYKALLEGKAVCQGFANLFYRLALEMGIDARNIASVAAENHAWNILQLGRWYYNIDATWDAENVETGYRWFLLNEAEFSVKHTRRAEFDAEAFHLHHPMGQTSYRGIGETLTGTCGSGLTWTLVPAGELTISGTGAMEDYVRDGEEGDCAPWMPWKTAITALSAEAETIGDSAFDGMTEVTEAWCAGSVKSIGDRAFADCESLQTIRFGGDLPAVGTDAFSGTGETLVLYYPAGASGWKSPTMTFPGTDSDGNAASVTVSAQSVGIPGDCNGDWEVTAEDADLLTKYFAGYPVMLNKWAADIDGSGTLTRADAMILRRYLAGWPEYAKYFA